MPTSFEVSLPLVYLIQRAIAASYRFGQPVGTEHFLIAMIEEDARKPAAQTLARFGLSIRSLSETVQQLYQTQSESPTRDVDLVDVYYQTFRECLAFPQQIYDERSVLLGILSLAKCNAVRVLGQLKVDTAELRASILVDIDRSMIETSEEYCPQPLRRQWQHAVSAISSEKDGAVEATDFERAAKLWSIETEARQILHQLDEAFR